MICIVLRCVAVCCSLLQCIAVCCNVLQCVTRLERCSSRRSFQRYTRCVQFSDLWTRGATSKFGILPRRNGHCNALQHTATHCNTLQHTATHCNTLQHTAIHCNTPPHPMRLGKIPNFSEVRPLSAREPRITGLFYGEWTIQIRHLMRLCQR